jgi:hypothetical protein
MFQVLQTNPPAQGDAMAHEQEVEFSPQRFSDVDMERAFLARILIDREIPQAVRYVEPGDFYDSLHEMIYAAMCAVQDRGEVIDFWLVLDQMSQEGTRADLELAGGLSYFDKCMDRYPWPGVEGRYAQRIVDLAGKRKLWIGAQTLLTHLANGEMDHFSADEIRTRHAARLSQLRVAPPAPRCATWADLEPLIGPIAWDWPGWLPRGFLTLLASEAGMGKSILALRLCACYLRGDDWPDGAPYCSAVGCNGGTVRRNGGTVGPDGSTIEPDNAAPGGGPSTRNKVPDGALLHKRRHLPPAAPPRNAGVPSDPEPPQKAEGPQVLWCEAEAAQVLNWERARSWGLPLDRILTPLEPLTDISLDTLSHRQAIEELAHRPEVRLVVVDSFSGASRRDENSSESLAAVQWLAALARDTGKAILLLHHLRKRGLLDGGNKVGLERLRGHSSIVQPARVVLALDAPDPNREGYKRLSVIKNNLSTFPEPVGFWVTKEGEMRFGDAPEAPQKATALERAMEALKDLLNEGPVPADKALAHLKEARISKRTAERAKARMGILSRSEGDHWLWELPPNGAEPTSRDN